MESALESAINVAKNKYQPESSSTSGTRMDSASTMPGENGDGDDGIVVESSVLSTEASQVRKRKRTTPPSQSECERSNPRPNLKVTSNAVAIGAVDMAEDGDWETDETYTVLQSSNSTSQGYCVTNPTAGIFIRI